MKTVILDGSNIVRSMYDTKTGIDFTKEGVLSDSLVRAMNSLNEDEPLRVEIYFDGPKRDVFRPSELVEVFFSKYKKADDLIVNSVEEIKDFYGSDVVVVTKDRELKDRCEVYGAHVMHTTDFLWRFRDFIDEFALA